MLDISKDVQNTREIAALTEAAQQGKLDSRADESVFEGNYRQIAEGANRLLDSLPRPVEEMMVTMGRAARKDMTARMDGECQGLVGPILSRTNRKYISRTDRVEERRGKTNANREKERHLL
ncbi:hypothetical protein LLH00_08140 [bacterium]|nr:hypothetical protein [bacterium]